MPKGLKRFLLAHRVENSAQLGWARLSNGTLLQAAENAGFDIIVTADQNIRYQQNLAGPRIALVVLGFNRWLFVPRHTAEIADVVAKAIMDNYLAWLHSH